MSHKMSSGFFKKNYKTPVIAAGGYIPSNATEHIRDGTTDMVAFGRWYIPNRRESKSARPLGNTTEACSMLRMKERMGIVTILR